MQITKELASKVLEVVDEGLIYGLGKPIPGNMCVEAAVNYALGADHNDHPVCVNNDLANFKIALNDKAWLSTASRAKGMRKLAIAQLGTGDADSNFKFADFIRRIHVITCDEFIIPYLKKMRWMNWWNPYFVYVYTQVINHLKRGESLAATKIMYNKTNSGFDTDSANYGPWTTMRELWGGNYPAVIRAINTDRNHNRYNQDVVPSERYGDEIYHRFAQRAVDVLVEMETPGSKFLYLTDAKH